MYIFEIAYLMIKRELTARYRGTIFGYLWSLLNPLAFALVYFIAFKYIVRIPVENYSVFLLCGLFPWIWISASIITGTKCFENFQALLKTGYVKPIVIPILVVSIELAYFLFSLPVLLIFLYIINLEINYFNLLYLPFLILFQSLFLIVSVAFVSCLSLVYRDIPHMVQILTQLLFFLSPIIYPLSMVPDKYLFIYKLNPFVNIFEMWRQVLYIGNVDFNLLIYPLFLGIILSIISFFLIKKIGERALEWM